MRFNLTNWLLEGKPPDKTAVLSGDRTLTYAEMSDMIHRVSNLLRSLGVGQGQAVLILLPDSPEFVAAYLGTIHLGAVAVPTNTFLRAEEYALFLEVSQARVVLTNAQLAPMLERYACKVVVCADDWLANSSPHAEAAATDGDDPAFWLWTSGSTGTPKAAVHRHRDWTFCCEGYARGVLGIGEGDRTFSSSKLFHAYGLGNGLVFPFYAGATTALYPHKAIAAAVLREAQARRPTLFFSVPTLYAAMLEETEPYELSSVRLAISAAEPLPADLFRRWKERFGHEILDGIGSTEVLHIYMSARPGQVRPGSSGQPVAGYEVRIVDEGDLQVRGQSTAASYWNQPALSAERMRGEWFHSGDKYRVDADGYYWYVGRSDDMFKVGGQWVSPIEVEGVLVSHNAVLEAVVIPYLESSGLGTSKAVVVLKRGHPATPDLERQLQEYVKQRITPYKYPRHIEFTSELPKSAAGKLLRFRARERWGS